MYSDYLNLLNTRFLDIQNFEHNCDIKDKMQRGQLIKMKTDLNKLKSNTSELEFAIINELFDSKHTHDLDQILKMYQALSTLGRFNSRYRKLPISWISLEWRAGFLEDFVVIMRNPSQIGLGNKQLFTISEIIKGIQTYLNNNDQHRFIFVLELFNRFKGLDLEQEIIKSIKCQGSSRRIGCLSQDKDYYYAIQGLYGQITYDPRVTQVLTVDAAPNYGIHFTKKDIAKAIWNKHATCNNRANGQQIPVGNIVRFDRYIHALSCVTKNDKGQFQIEKDYAEIRNRMVHGISDQKRPKYDAGLVFDVKQLISQLPMGSVIINELGTLLISCNIPHNVLLAHLYTEDQLNLFWSV